MPKRILILCTGNSARSQMAEGFLRRIDPNLEIFSAGTHPASIVHPIAVNVMKEVGIDLSYHRPKDLREFIDQSFDYVITVCDHAKESCPVFVGAVKHRLHLGFKDPAEAAGTDEEITAAFRSIRDEIKRTFGKFYDEHISRKGA